MAWNQMVSSYVKMYETILEAHSINVSAPY